MAQPANQDVNTLTAGVVTGGRAAPRSESPLVDLPRASAQVTTPTARAPLSMIKLKAPRWYGRPCSVAVIGGTTPPHPDPLAASSLDEHEAARHTTPSPRHLSKPEPDDRPSENRGSSHRNYWCSSCQSRFSCDLTTFSHIEFAQPRDVTGTICRAAWFVRIRVSRLRQSRHAQLLVRLSRDRAHKIAAICRRYWPPTTMGICEGE